MTLFQGLLTGRDNICIEKLYLKTGYLLFYRKYAYGLITAEEAFPILKQKGYTVKLQSWIDKSQKAERVYGEKEKCSKKSH